MARVLLGVTGSVAAIRTPELFETLRVAGHSVRVVATEPALHFFDHSVIGSAQSEEPSWIGGPLFRDADEWAGTIYRRGDPVLHIELRKWADMLIVAPLDANTLAKFALGLSDNCLTCVFRAWDFSRPVILAPAMNTLMWESPVTLRHLRQLLNDHGDPRASRIAGRGPRDLRPVCPETRAHRPASQATGVWRYRPRRDGRGQCHRRGRPRLVRARAPWMNRIAPRNVGTGYVVFQSDRIEDGNDANPQA